ncbi:hypothetical protein DAPPUDRAFT_247952 [Daphnia pulex]|uniref:Uncharacterized protein n=1 Tax=Daphnia pulex TaxID=6669 RepID=E9GT67_DAPPU|nr:hypothetical protein DAPPUDRAFT_247952 [Daphnia pulex]|eukprot:EFX77316.1 hypothetical protein DAPPUDRAFT_247952 [Daphnia pulex]
MQEDILKSINAFCVFNLHHMDTAGVFTRDSQAQDDWLLGYIINLLVVATIMLASALILAVAKEMQWFPDSWIRHASKELARKRTSEKDSN